MKYLISAACSLFIAGLYLTSDTKASELQSHAMEARKIIKSFATTLKGQLVGAMKHGGPVSAIGVCNAAAPALTEGASEQSGWKVARTSLKLRNPENKPDAWEFKILEQFEAERKKGANPKNIEHFEVTTLNGKKVFRFMKAIATDKPCLSCHGASVKSDVNEALKNLYPEDKAIGFKLGDVRGAFTLTKQLDQ